MPLISSPIAYPRTSSPVYESPRKKRKLEQTRDPLVVLPTNGAPTKRAGFLLDDSDEEDSSNTARDNEPDAGDDAVASKGQGHEWDEDHEEEDITVRRMEETQDSCLEAGHGRYAEINAALYHKPILGVRPTHATRTCSGKIHNIRRRPKHTNVHYQQLAAGKSQIQANRAQKEYYGVDVHRLMEAIAAEDEQNAIAAAAEHDIQRDTVATSVECVAAAPTTTTSPTLLWTEKYRARKFTDLVGDERIHRSVLHWLKSWDTIVFPHAARPRLSKKAKLRAEDDGIPQRMRKVLILTGPPGLGKTTLAHVCAKQAGYEVQEINASDERSRDVVKGRIRDMVCTENVKAIGASASGKATRPVCVVVDEVDGVVGGSSGGGGGGGGEGGFVKALLDLLVLDQKNTKVHDTKKTFAETKSKKRAGDNFRLLRPLILICNDLYHPSLRLLRQSNMAEIVYIRKPALNMIIPRMQSIFEKENIPCDPDGVRQLCEVTWGVSSRKEDRSTGGAGEGDMRGVLVVGEWVATKFKSQQTKSDTGPVPARLTKRWLEEHILNDLAQGGGAARGLGRGSSKEVVERVFSYNAGFPVHATSTKSTTTSDKVVAQTGSSEAKQRAMQRLQEMVQSSGEDDRIMTDCFTTYAGTPFQDDPLLTKPTTAADRWLHFHDTLSTLVYSSAQEWGLAPYLSSSILAFHHLFAATSKHAYASGSTKTNNTADGVDSGDAKTSLTGPRAPTIANELTRTNLATLRDLQSSLSIPLHRAFRSPADLSMDLLPYLVRILNPDIKPVVVGGSGGPSGVVGTASVRRAPEKARVSRAVEAMVACGVKFEQGRVEDVVDAGAATPMSSVTTNAGRIYRMNPALDALSVFDTASGGGLEKVRFAVRQVLDQEYGRDATRRDQEARAARMQTPVGMVDAHEAQSSDLDKTIPVAIVATASTSTATKRDFFGRPVIPIVGSGPSATGNSTGSGHGAPQNNGRIWVTFHEGFSNAVRKPITLKELMEGM